MTAPDIIGAVMPVIRTFEALRIPYYVGGSLASSVYGIARATLDMDLVAAIQSGQIQGLVEALRDEYYIDHLMIAEAIDRRTSFNLVHLATSIKVDVFVPPEGSYPRSAMQRRREDTLQEGGQVLFLCSAEDIILAKLQWCELGEGVSERQWLDITGIIKVQGQELDVSYLRRWAAELGLSSLLREAFADSGLPLP